IPPRYYSATDKKVQITVLIDIRGAYAGTANEHFRENCSCKSTVALVEVKPVLQQAITYLIFIASAYDINILVAVVVGIEENRVDILTVPVFLKFRLMRFHKLPLLVLQEQRCRLAFRSPGKHVGQAVMVNIGHGKGRTHCRIRSG